MRKFSFYLSFVAFLLPMQAFSSDSIALLPGEWVIETRILMLTMPEPQISTSTQCLKTGVFQAEDMLAQQDECTIINSNVSENQLTWEVMCGVNGGQTKGQGVFTAQDTHAEGKLHLTTEIDGQQFTNNISWVGTYQGPCN